MIVVSFDKELREAFAAGQQSIMHLIAKASKAKGIEAWCAGAPKTYDEWIASIRDRPCGPPIG